MTAANRSSLAPQDYLSSVRERSWPLFDSAADLIAGRAVASPSDGSPGGVDGRFRIERRELGDSPAPRVSVIVPTFDRPALLEYYTSVLPQIVGTAPVTHHLKCVQPVEWLPASAGERVGATINEVLGTLTAQSPGSVETAAKGFVERMKTGAKPQMPVTILPVLDVVPPDELTRWTKIAGEPIWNEWVKKMEGKGHANAREILSTALELLKN